MNAIYNRTKAEWRREIIYVRYVNTIKTTLPINPDETISLRLIIIEIIELQYDLI